MKPPLKSRRPSPEDALAIASQAAPAQPPAQVVPAGRPDPRTTLNLRMRKSTVDALEAAAKTRGLTLKLVVTQALEAAGIQVAPPDLEDRTPKRRT